MDGLDLQAERRLGEILAPGESPVEVVRTSYDRNGAVGDGYVIVTPLRLIVGDRPIAGEVRLSGFPLSQVRGIDLQQEGPRGTVAFLGDTGEVARACFSALEADRLSALPPLLERLRAEPKAPHAPATGEVDAGFPPISSPASPLIAPPPDASPAGIPAEAEAVPMAIVLADHPRPKPSAPGDRGLHLTLDRDAYLPGDTVRASLRLGWPGGAVRGVWWEVEGAERTHVTVQKGSGKNRHSVTYRECRPLLRAGRVLFGARKSGFFSRAWEGLRAFLGMRTDNPVLPAGEYGYDFEMALPGDAPPAYQGTNAVVAYELRARVDIPGAVDLTASAPIRVGSRPIVAITGAGGEHLPGQGLARLFTADVEMQIEVVDRSFRPGDPLPFHVRVKNLGGKRVRGLDVALNRRESARARGYSASSSSTVERLTIPVERLRLDGESMPLEIPLPQEMLRYDGAYSRLAWELHAGLDIAWGIDAAVTAPLRVE